MARSVHAGQENPSLYQPISITHIPKRWCKFSSCIVGPEYVTASRNTELSFPENLPEVSNGFSHSQTHKHFKHSCAKLLILFKHCSKKRGQEVGKEREKGKQKNFLRQSVCLLESPLKYMLSLFITQEIFIILTRETRTLFSLFLKAAPG